MKFICKALASAVALGMSVSANAALFTIPNGTDLLDTEIAVIILNKDNDESLLVNTGLRAQGVFDGSVTSYTTPVSITDDISSFLGGSTNADFYAFGSIQTGAGTGAVNGSLISHDEALDATNTPLFSSAIINFLTSANTFEFGNDAAGDGPDVENTTGTDFAFVNPFVNNRNQTKGSLGAGPNPFVGSTFETPARGQAGIFTEVDLGGWTLDANGELNYAAVSAVPVPAAVWLFGSGLLGLIGVARRRSV